MQTKVGVFYSADSPGPDRIPVAWKGTTYYTRGEWHDTDSAVDAVNNATCRADEIVLLSTLKRRSDFAEKW